MVIGKLGNETERIFNLRYVKAVQPDNCTVLLYGNMKPFLVTRESIGELLKVMDECTTETPFSIYTKAYYDRISSSMYEEHTASWYERFKKLWK